MVGWQRRIPLGGRRVIRNTAFGRSSFSFFPLLPGRPFFLLAHRRSWATCAELRHDGARRTIPVPNDEQDKTGVIAPPPLIYLAALIFGLLLGRRFPMRFLPRTMARGLGW